MLSGRGRGAVWTPYPPLDKVDKESSNSAWYSTEVLEIQKELGEAGKCDGFVSCHPGEV